MGWLIALGILALIAILPIGVSAFYDEDGPRVFATGGPVRMPLFPVKKKAKKQKIEKKKTTKASSGKSNEKKKGGKLQDFLPIVDAVLDFLSAFGRKLRVKRLEMKLILAADDPADLAQNYGRAWTALGNLMPLLENAFKIQKRDLDVGCDFLATDTVVTARLDLTITVGRLLSLVTVQGVPIIRELMKILNKRKGGAKA